MGLQKVYSCKQNKINGAVLVNKFLSWTIIFYSWICKHSKQIVFRKTWDVKFSGLVYTAYCSMQFWEGAILWTYWMMLTPSSFRCPNRILKLELDHNTAICLHQATRSTDVRSLFYPLYFAKRFSQSLIFLAIYIAHIWVLDKSQVGLALLGRISLLPHDKKHPCTNQDFHVCCQVDLFCMVAISIVRCPVDIQQVRITGKSENNSELKQNRKP